MDLARVRRAGMHTHDYSANTTRGRTKVVWLKRAGKTECNRESYECMSVRYRKMLSGGGAGLQPL